MPDSTAVKKQKNKWMYTKNLLFAFSFFAVAAINDSPGTKSSNSLEQRRPASLSTGILPKVVTKPFMKHTSKLSPPLFTQINSDNREVNEGDVFKLTGTFRASQAMNNVNVKWILPKGVEIINGTVNSQLNSVEAGKKYLFELNLKATTNDNQMIHLVAESRVGDSSFSNSSQFQTQLQKAYDESYERLHQRAKEYISEK